MSDLTINIWKNGHSLQSDWGVIEHGDPRPDLGHVGPYMITTREYAAVLIKHGGRASRQRACGSVDSLTVVPANPDEELTEDSELRLFMHCDYAGQRWTWELYEAQWSDWPDGPSIYIGRWPD